jgi:glycosyltransferase involved in cell wall biosynthesis
MNTALPPKVSIGVVTYNAAPYIAACLDSIRDQDHPHIEAFVVDDASTDGTVGAVEAWRTANPGVVGAVYAHTQNMGIARNFNFALERLSGDYGQLFAGDDVMLPGKIAAQVAAMEAAPGAVLSFTNMEWFWSATGRKICNHFGLLQRPSTRLADIVADNTVPSPTWLWRLDAVGGTRFRERLRYLNDFFFIVEMLNKGPALYVPMLGVRYRKHPGSTTLREFFYRDRLRALSMLRKALGPEYAPAIARFARTVDYARAMTRVQMGQRWRAAGELARLAPAALLSPKWAARVGAVGVKLVQGCWKRKP